MKFKSKLFDILYLFLKTMDSNKKGASSSTFLSTLYIFIHFAQMLSYLFKVTETYILDDQFQYFEKMFIYLNFSNLILFLDRLYVSLIAYFVAIYLIVFLLVYIMLLYVLKKIFSFKTSKLLSYCNFIYSKTYELFVGILTLPIIDILMFPLYCDKQDGNDLFCDGKVKKYLVYVSIPAIVLTVGLGFLHILIIRNYAFLDMTNFRMSFNYRQIACFCLKISLAIFYPLINRDNEYIYHLILHGIAFFSGFDYVFSFPIRNPKLNKFYISILLSFEGVLMVLTFWKFFALIQDGSLLIVLMVLIVFLIKKGIGISNFRSFSILLNTFKEKKKMDYILEELVILFNSHRTSAYSNYIMCGLLKSHAKNCTFKKCKFTAKHMNKFHNVGIEDQEMRINSFIFQRFIILIDQLRREAYCEEVILKFMSYLINSNLSPQKAFLEAQKLPNILKDISFYSRLVFVLLNKKLQTKIDEIDKERHLKETKFDQNGNLQIKEFFVFTLQKENLEAGMKNLLKAKISLWEKFQSGFQSYEEAIHVLNGFAEKALAFKSQLENYLKTAKDSVILYKFFSIFNCVIVNRMIEAVKYEDEIENIRKRYIRADLDQLSPIIFFQDNYIVCEASFLNSKGVILESSKTVKFAKFFNYNVEETKLMKNIESLMPGIYSENHFKFVNWNLNRPTKELVTKKAEVLAFAQDKEELIFPIKIFLSHSFNYENDFVMHAALLKLDWKGVPCLLFDSSGSILGLTKEFFVKFKEDLNQITVPGIQFLNIFNLVAKLKENVLNNKIFEEETSFEYRNLNGNFLIFQNLLEVIDLIKYRRSQMEMVKKDGDTSRNLSISSRSYASKVSKSSRTQKSDISNKISRYISKWQQTSKNQNFVNKDLLNKAFLDESWNDEGIIEILTEKVAANKRRILYDISIHQSRFGRQKSDVIRIASLNVKYMSEPWLAQEEPKPITTINIVSSVSINSKLSDSSFKSLKMPGENNFDFKVEFDRLNNSRSEMSVTPSMPREIENFEPKASVPLKTNESEKEAKINQDVVVETQEMFISKKEKEGNFVKSMDSQQNYEGADLKKEDKMSVVSSTKSKEEKRLKNLNGKTTDLAMENKENENSLNASSRSTSKRSYAIISMMEVIQFKYPKSIRNISLLFLFQIAMIFCFCIALYILSDSYINNYYLPLQEAAIEQSKVNSDFAFFACIFNEEEYLYRGLETMTEFQLYAFEKLVRLVYQEAVGLLHNERTKPPNFQYQPYLHFLPVTLVSYQDYKPQTVLFNDMTDFFLLMVQMHMNEESIDVTPLDVRNVLQRNMVYYLPAAANVRAKIQEEFLSSNQIIGSQILIIFVLMMSVIALEKTIEYSVYLKFMDKITKLVNIFLRISQREATSEFYMAKQILELLNDNKKSYQNDYFPDKCANKTQFNEMLEGMDADKNKKTKKQQAAAAAKKAKLNSSKKFSLYNLRTLSKNKVFAFLFISGGLIVGYLVGNYVFWTITNSSISQLISINNMFNNLYIYSTTTMAYNNLMIREAGEKDPLYEASGEPLQDHQKRMQYFLSAKQSRLNFLLDYVHELPNFALPAQSVINDVNYDELMHGSSCSALYKKGRLDDEMFAFCKKDFKGAFTKGILNFMNQFIQIMTDQYSITFIPKNQSDIDFQKAQLDIYYNDITTGTLPISVYVITRGLILFYEYISSYYGDVLSAQLSNMNLLLWITCVICFIIMATFCILMLRYTRNIYFRTAFILGLIPNEKLINDEQTIYLIKQFWKENN